MVKVHQIRVPEYVAPGNNVDVELVVSHNLDGEISGDKFKHMHYIVEASHRNNPVMAGCISIPKGEKYVLKESTVDTVGHYHEYTPPLKPVGNGTLVMPSENIEINVGVGGIRNAVNTRISGDCTYTLAYAGTGNASKKVKYMPFGFRPSNTKIDDVSVVGGGLSSLEAEVTYKVTSPVDVVADSELPIIDIEAGSILKTASLSSKLKGTNQQNATVKRTAKLNIEAGERIPESINLCGKVNNAKRAT